MTRIGWNCHPVREQHIPCWWACWPISLSGSKLDWQVDLLKQRQFCSSFDVSRSSISHDGSMVLPYIWVNYNDLTATSLESWLVREIIPNGLNSGWWNIIIYPDTQIYISIYIWCAMDPINLPPLSMLPYIYIPAPAGSVMAIVSSLDFRILDDGKEKPRNPMVVWPGLEASSLDFTLGFGRGSRCQRWQRQGTEICNHHGCAGWVPKWLQFLPSGKLTFCNGKSPCY